MTIESKGWTAHRDNMPGNAGIRVSGTVTVANPGVRPVLSVRPAQDKSFNLALDLTLEEGEGAQLMVITQAPVSFSMPSEQPIPQVHIFHDGELIATITDIADVY